MVVGHASILRDRAAIDWAIAAIEDFGGLPSEQGPTLAASSLGPTCSP